MAAPVTLHNAHDLIGKQGVVEFSSSRGDRVCLLKSECGRGIARGPSAFSPRPHPSPQTATFRRQPTT